MTGWLRRLAAFGLVLLLAVSQTLVSSVAVAQRNDAIQGEMLLRGILAGEAVEGEISNSDVNTEGAYFDTLVFMGYADDTITVTLGPSPLAGLLIVANPYGEILGELEFGPTGSVRSLRVTLPLDGTYVIWIGSERFGSYSVMLSSKGGSGDIDPTTGLGSLDIEALQFGQWHEGELEESEITSGDAEGVVIDLFMLKGTPGQRYRITVESDDFDPVLIISSAAGEDPTMEIGRDGRAVVRGRFNSEGVLTLGVTSADEQLGSYRIIVEPDERR